MDDDLGLDLTTYLDLLRGGVSTIPPVMSKPHRLFRLPALVGFIFYQQHRFVS